MTQLTAPDDRLSEPPLLAWPQWVNWSLALGLALIVFELSGNNALTISPICFKLAIGDFWTAFWIRRRDPDRGRGRTLFWLMWAYGWAKFFVAGLCLMTILSIVAAGHRGNQPLRMGLLMMFEEVALGVMASNLLLVHGAAVALLRAWFSGQPLMVGYALRHARKRGVFPPIENGPNQLGWLLTAWLLAAIPTCIVFAFATGDLIGLVRPRGVNPLGAAFGLIATFSLAAPVFCVVVVSRIAERLWANSVFDLWTLKELLPLRQISHRLPPQTCTQIARALLVRAGIATPARASRWRRLDPAELELDVPEGGEDARAWPASGMQPRFS